MSSLVDTVSSADYPKCLAKIRSADVAQLAEHLICNQAVASSSLAVSSGPEQWMKRGVVGRWNELVCVGGVPKWPTGADCKSAGASLRRFESFPHHRG